MDVLKNALRRPPPWLIRFVKETGRGINRFSMIREGEKVIIGVSGGKDSLALSLALSMRKRWIPIDYSLLAVRIVWNEYPLPREASEKIDEFFHLLDIPLRVIRADMFASSFKGKFDCYLCSRNRKRILFEEAKNCSVSKIALGHHLDDIVETTLINICLRGNFSTMMPVQHFFDGALSIIRPLCLVKEQKITAITEKLDLPVTSVPCPHRETNIRSAIKPIVKELVRIDKYAREHIFESPWNINEDYLPRNLHQT